MINKIKNRICFNISIEQYKLHKFNELLIILLTFVGIKNEKTTIDILWFCRGFERIRTAVDGFADHCLATRPRNQRMANLIIFLKICAFYSFVFYDNLSHVSIYRWIFFGNTNLNTRNFRVFFYDFC